MARPMTQRNHSPPRLRTLAASRPELRQAEAVWSAALEPELLRKEQAHQQAMLAAIIKTGVAAATPLLLYTLAISAFGATAFSWAGPFGSFGVVAAMAGSVFLVAGMDWLHLYNAKARTKDLVVRAACTLFGFEYRSLKPPLSDIKNLAGLAAYLRQWRKTYSAVGAGYEGVKFKLTLGGDMIQVPARGDDPPTPAYDSLRDAGLLPAHDSRRFEDLITGKRGDVSFSLVEAKLVSTLKRGSPVEFRGLMFHVAFPDRFLGRTIVARSGWIKGASPVEGLQRVRLVSAELERAFSVYSSDQVEARALLSPDRMERLIALERHFAGQKLRLVFGDGHMTVALAAAHDQFEAGSMFRPLVDPGRFATVLQELSLVCDILDGFMTRDWVARRHGQAG